MMKRTRTMNDAALGLFSIVNEHTKTNERSLPTGPSIAVAYHKEQRIASSP